MSGNNLVRPALNILSQKLTSIAHLSRAKSVLEWDQLVMMPQADTTSASRGAQLATLAGVIHEMSTAHDLGLSISAAEEELASSEEVPPREIAIVREARREFDREANVSPELTKEAALLGSEAYATWAKARQESNFNMFEPMLARCFETAAELALARAGIRRDGHGELPHDSDGGVYESCLEDFERGMGSERIDAIFDQVEVALAPLIKRVLASKSPPSDEVLSPASSRSLSEGTAPWWPRAFPLKAQEALNRQVVEAMGFDSTTGRVDVSVHPFTTSFGPNDVRITSRFSDQEWYQGLAGSMHECGHALYESQLRDTALPVDRPLSMGVHESQSLFWERHVGLSRPFWTWCGPLVRQHLFCRSEGAEGGGSVAAASDDPRCSDDALFGAVNRVSRGLIRVEADELTYPMHVILRYRLERQIVSGSLPTTELPKAWVEGLRGLLGDDLEVPSDAVGCLQDVHWSSLAVGYFPTYLLGAIMAAQLDHYLRQDQAFLAAHGGSEAGSGSEVVDALVSRGQFAPLKEWLKEKVHDKGCEPASMDELLLDAFGEPLNPKYYLEYLTAKYSELYSL